jgi:hypothetical protein
MTGPGWVARLTAPFSDAVVQRSRLSIILDRDRLYGEAKVAAALAARGVDSLELADPMVFRLAYETEWRAGAADGARRHVAVVVAPPLDERDVPFDVLRRAKADGTVFAVGVADAFPHLDPSEVMAVRNVDRTIWDALPDGPVTAFGTPRRLSAAATADTIVQAAWGVDLSRVADASSAVAALVAWHLRPGPAVPTLADHVASAIRRVPVVAGWPVDRWVRDRGAFLQAVGDGWRAQLLVEGWRAPYAVGGAELAVDPLPGFVEALGGATAVDAVRRVFDAGGLAPFDLTPPIMQVGHGSVAPVPGVLGFVGDDGATRLSRAIDRALGGGVPAVTAPAREWLALARRWAPVTVARVQANLESGHPILREMASREIEIERAFETWLTDRSCANYDGLFTLTRAEAPMTLDKVAGHAARHLGRTGGGARVAVLVVDGMGLPEWELIRPMVARAVPDGITVDDATFAMVPTLTAVSRQTIFAGAPPPAIASEMAAFATNTREKAQWAAFWAGQDAALGVNSSQVGYVSQGDREPDALVADVAALVASDVRALGIVAMEVDKIMHGALGLADHHDRVRRLASEPIARVVDCLARAGFTTFVTADHGAVEVTGSGQFIRGGVTTTSEGSRMVAFKSEILRDDAVRDTHDKGLSGCISWASRIREDYRPLFPPARLTFGSAKGRAEVTHGGIMLQEVIVPFVRIDPR